MSDQIDPTAGIKIHKKLGQKVHKGEPLYTLFGKSESQFEEACQRLLASTTISEQPDDSAPLISKVLLGTN